MNDFYIPASQVESMLISQAAVVFSTVSSSAKFSMRGMYRRRPIVIVDEAAQLAEAEGLVALRTKVARLVLVGDDKQLPAVVFSNKCRAAGYDRSMFARLREQGAPAVMLNTQYRMDPAISKFPREAFYDGLLYDGTTSSPPEEPRLPLWPYTFVHVPGCEFVDAATQSRRNPLEAVAVCKYLRSLYQLSVRAGETTQLSVGIIAGYSAQVRCISDRLRRMFAVADEHGALESTLGQTVRLDNGWAVDIRTVDGFQGLERDMILFSCVRSGADDFDGRVGFMGDRRRLNVALTRARRACVVFGDSEHLARNSKVFAKLVADARQRGVFHDDAEGLLKSLSESERADCGM